LIEARRIPFISGFELFFHQGVDAFSIFTGFDVTDKMALSDVLFRTLCCKGQFLNAPIAI
jgi:shikimate 5-dehydrogenase